MGSSVNHRAYRSRSGIERVNEGRATRGAEKKHERTLFDVWRGDEGETFREGARNKLIWVDNLLVKALLVQAVSRGLTWRAIAPAPATGLSPPQRGVTAPIIRPIRSAAEPRSSWSCTSWLP